MDREVAELEAWLAHLDVPVKVDGMTAAEIAKLKGLTIDRTRRALRAAIEAGAWEYAGKRRATRINGTSCQVAVYRPVKGARTGSKK